MDRVLNMVCRTSQDWNILHMFQKLYVTFLHLLSVYRWEKRTSAVTPDDEVFYLVAFLRSALDNGDSSQTLEYLNNQNRQILKFCDDNGIKIKQYLPHYTTQKEWIEHFGDKWSTFYRRKMEFDPKHILATGQGIFYPNFSYNEWTFQLIIQSPHTDHQFIITWSEYIVLSSLAELKLAYI